MSKKVVPKDWDFKCIFSTTRYTSDKKHPTRISSIEILVTVHIKPVYCFLFIKGITWTQIQELFANLKTIPLQKLFFLFCFTLA